MLAKGCNCMASLIYLVVQSSRVTGLLSVGFIYGHGLPFVYAGYWSWQSLLEANNE